MDQIHTLVQPKARALGAAINTEESYLANFAEESIRGLPTFHLSQESTLNPPFRVPSCRSSFLLNLAGPLPRGNVLGSGV